MKITNKKMHLYLNSLTAISNKVKGKLAYAVARNIRKISNELIEFNNIRDNYINEHGTKNKDGYMAIDIHSEEYKKFLKYIEDYLEIEHEVDIYMISEEEVYTSELTANEILNLDFMIIENK